MTANLTVKLDTSGLDKLLKRLGPRADDLVQATAKGIVKAAVSSMKGGGQPHKPSEALEPPRRDIGNLANSGYTKKEKRALWLAGFDSEYALPLEKGTTTIEPRPFLGPQVERWRGPFLRAQKELFKT